MLGRIKRNISSNFNNFRGFKTNQKIVVIESDDWGSIRIPNLQAISSLRELGLAVDNCHYILNDTLESQSDLESLFDVLSKFKDRRGEHPKLTANTIVCNPDFDKIKSSNFEHYYTEINTQTFQSYFGNPNVEEVLKQGIDNGLYKPQLHGREHVNVSRWMKLLRENDEITRRAFDLKLFGISGHIFRNKRPTLMAAFDLDTDEAEFNAGVIITEAVEVFEKLFGYTSTSFIAPNFVWDKTIEKVLFDNKIMYIQGSAVQTLSRKSDNLPYTYKKNYLGKKNTYGQTYLTRNVNFEPSSNLEKDWVSSALYEISNSFFWRRPAIINSHRVNYVSGLNPKNASSTLQLLNQLLSEIQKKWPDVIFMSTDELCNMISTSKNITK